MIKNDFSLNREKMLAFLSGSTGRIPGSGTTLYIPPQSAGARVADDLSPFIPEPQLREIRETVFLSKAGACILIDDGITVILPPFPVKQPLIFQGIDTSLLENMLKRDSLLAVVLIRLGSYAVGVCRGDTLISSKVGTGLVHGRHRQGGSSANRFRRHREKQIETFLTRACGHVKEHLEQYIDVFEYAAFGGARMTVELLQKACPLLQKLEGRLLPPLLDIPDPRQYVLEDAVRRIWSSRIIEYREEE
jgi:hypothetical protein